MKLKTSVVSFGEPSGLSSGAELDGADGERLKLRDRSGPERVSAAPLFAVSLELAVRPTIATPNEQQQRSNA